MSNESAFNLKKNIDFLINQIIKFEDDIKFHKNNNEYKNALIDRAKNIEHIHLLNQFIQNENKLYNNNNLKIKK